jgi:hypothetical protein
MNARQINFADTTSKGAILSLFEKIIAATTTNSSFLVSLSFYGLVLSNTLSFHGTVFPDEKMLSRAI